MRAVVLCPLMIVVGLAACSTGPDDACAAVERLVDASSVHVLPGATVTYEWSPPTSGPHLLPAPDPGAHPAAIEEPRQVAALEAGYVLIQYQSDVPAEDVLVLEGLAAADGVLVAPAAKPFDDDASVALTAWGTRQLCDEVDETAARDFVEDRVGVFFVEHGG